MSTIKVNTLQNASGSGGVDIQGTNTNDAATAGDVGEVKTGSTARSSAVALTTTGTVFTVATLSNVDPGDWDLGAYLGLDPGVGTTITVIGGAISKTAATLPASGTFCVPTSGEVRFEQGYGGATIGDNDLIIPLPGFRVSIAATTTFYLVAGATFAVSTLFAYGSIEARRRR